MTGFATVTTEGTPCLRLTIKSVNHRFLDLSMRLPAGCDALEAQLRRMVRERVRRGHVDVTIAVGESSGARAGVNEEALRGYVLSLRAAAESLSLSGELDLAALARLPGVIRTEGEQVRPAAGLDEAALRCFPQLLTQFETAREEEGAALCAALRISLRRLQELAAEIRQCTADLCAQHQARLKVRLEHLLAGTVVSESRLLAEAAVLAERGDIEEELLRLETHLSSFARLLDEGGELGKRLDFLSQELNREVNTMLSKAGSVPGQQGLRTTDLTLQCKAEIERMREQVQNIE